MGAVRLIILTTDSFLQAVISGLKTPSCTVIISTTSILNAKDSSSASAHYEFEPAFELGEEFADSVHQELKRDFSSHIQRRASDDDDDSGNRTSREDLALFEKYQFFTPGRSFHIKEDFYALLSVLLHLASLKTSIKRP